jgi:outer membrane protein TolC
LLIGIFVTAGGPFPAVAGEELTWQDCLREAAKNHPDVIAAQEGIVQGKATRAIVTSDYLPQITADLNATNTQADTSGSSNNFNYGVSGTQLLFNGFKTVNNINAASANVQVARESFKFTSADVRLRLREAFVTLLKAQQQLDLTQEIAKIRKDNLDLISLRYQSGTEHRGALLTALANMAQADFEINQAKRGLEVAQRQLIKEMGRTQFAPIAVKGDFQVSDAVLQKPDFEALAKATPSFLKAAAQVNAAAFNMQADKGDFWPTISLNGGLSRSGDRWTPNDQATSAGVKVALPVFEGGAREARISRDASAYRQARQQQRSTLDGVVLALAQEWAALQDTVENVKVQKSFLDAAQERAKIAEQQYSVGLVSFDNWTIIEDDLVNNKKSFLNVQANALLAEANWIQAKGETLEYEN